jgi:ferredoxin-type protein NapF
MSLAAGTITATAAALAVSPAAASQLAPTPKEGPVTPPGSKGYTHLASHCTSCYACVSVCPTRVIRPAFLEYGTQGLFKPVLDYSHGFCEYGCTRCLEVCPSGAILPASLTDKKRIQIGLSHLDIEKCVVKLNKEDCGACAEACPTRAVVMVLYEDGLFYPETRRDYCIGCGACEYACPARPLAITVTGKREHGVAAMAHIHVQQIEAETDPVQADEGEEEFPF